MEELKEGKDLALCSKEAIELGTKPIGRAVHNKAMKKKKNENINAHWSDRVKCEVCGVTFTRSARSNHNKTKVHKAYLDINKKLRDMLINK